MFVVGVLGRALGALDMGLDSMCNVGNFVLSKFSVVLGVRVFSIYIYMAWMEY